VVAVLLVACGGSSGKSAAKSPTSTTPSTVVIGGTNAILRGTATAQESGSRIEVDDNFFEPNVITGAGTVTFTVENRGAGLHNFSLAEQSVDNDLKPGSTTSVTVTFPSSGELVFFCKYHRAESGMVGVLRAAP
jgi:plastocyanin